MRLVGSAEDTLIATKFFYCCSFVCYNTGREEDSRVTHCPKSSKGVANEILPSGMFPREVFDLSDSVPPSRTEINFLDPRRSLLRTGKNGRTPASRNTD